MEEVEVEIRMKNDEPSDSPKSVLEDEDICAETHVKEVVEVKQEEICSEVRVKEVVKVKEEVTEELDSKKEEVEHEPKIADTNKSDSRFAKLDELLTQTNIYSEFLLEKMEGITGNSTDIKAEDEDTNKGKKTGRSRKRKATIRYNPRKAKTAVAAMLKRSRDDIAAEDACLTEVERAAREQAELVPLMTGGILKPYQVKGVKWMISLWQNGLNGILADQMGLGKTIQTLGFLAHLKGNGLDGPYMVVAPLSTLSNWENEVLRFVPSMSSIIYHGTKEERMALRKKYMPNSISPKFPLIITSYEVAMNDAKTLAQYHWKYVVVDEGHRLKNMNCLLLKRLKLLRIENKLLLTGTPLQNNLAELWSLLNFILPDIFSSHNEFESWFDFSAMCNEVEEDVDEEKKRVQVVSKLHSILRPFLLRRLKEDVEQNLPRKKEIIIYANMTPYQKTFQEHLIKKTLVEYLDETESWGFQRTKGFLNNVVIQLRKNCNHPDLLVSPYDVTSCYPPIEKIVGDCGKFQLLDRLVNLLLERKHKILIFSQWTKILDIIEYYFCEKGIDCCRIDGSVKLAERRRQIDEFNDLNSSLRIFLLSTRAGGLGINLTAADTCIIYDSDWNPQADLQAMDRCHRIGQTRPVHVYRLATANSVENRMIKRAFEKLKLEHVVIGQGQFHQERVKPDKLEEAEVLSLLRGEEDTEDKLTQADISDEDLVRVLDRSDLVDKRSDEDCPDAKKVDDGGSDIPFPLRGPGWEVVIPVQSGGSVLSSLNS